MNLSSFRIFSVFQLLGAASLLVLFLPSANAQPSASAGNALTPPAPSANFGVTHPCLTFPNQAVKIVNFSKNATRFLWHFEGGSPDTFEGKNPPEIFYPQAGTYSITLIAQDAQGRGDTLSAKNFIKVGHTLDFSANVTQTSCAPLITTFQAKATGCVRRYKWDFGDGSVSSSQTNPMHVYNQNGTYDVKLILTYEDGARDSLVKPAYVRVSALGGTYQIDKKELNVNGKVTFNIYTNAHVMLEPKPGEVQFAMKNTAPATWDSVKMSYTYVEVGVYEPIVRVMSDEGCMTTLPSQGEVLVADKPRRDWYNLTTSISPKKRIRN